MAKLSWAQTVLFSNELLDVGNTTTTMDREQEGGAVPSSRAGVSSPRRWSAPSPPRPGCSSGWCWRRWPLACRPSEGHSVKLKGQIRQYLGLDWLLTGVDCINKHGTGAKAQCLWISPDLCWWEQLGVVVLREGDPVLWPRLSPWRQRTNCYRVVNWRSLKFVGLFVDFTWRISLTCHHQEYEGEGWGLHPLAEVGIVNLWCKM